jgi:hypothetical protein
VLVAGRSIPCLPSTSKHISREQRSDHAASTISSYHYIEPVGESDHSAAVALPRRARGPLAAHAENWNRCRTQKYLSKRPATVTSTCPSYKPVVCESCAKPADASEHVSLSCKQARESFQLHMAIIPDDEAHGSSLLQCCSSRPMAHQAVMLRLSFVLSAISICVYTCQLVPCTCLPVPGVISGNTYGSSSDICRNLSSRALECSGPMPS